MQNIFISYRREDSPGYAGRLYDRLQIEFGQDNLFRDVDTLQPGDDFVDAINRTLNKCDVVLTVIGPRWLTVEDEQHRRRLDDEFDFVRLEVQTALERKIRVIPVLVERATMPKQGDLPAPLQGLTRRQAIELSDTRWNYDVDQLIRSLRSRLTAESVQERGSGAGGPPTQSGPSTASSQSRSQRQFEPPSLHGSVPHRLKIAVTQRSVVKIDYTTWLADSLRISPNSQRLAFIDQQGGILGIGTKYRVIVDAIAGRVYDKVDELIFSPDSARAAHRAKSNNKWVVVVDGREGHSYDDLANGYLAFSPDGQRVAYGAKRNNKWVAVVDGQEGNPYDDLANGYLSFSPDGQRIAYGARTNNKWVAVVDGQEGQQYDALMAGGLVFSPDGQRIAYGAKTNNKWVVVVDGQEGRQYVSLQGGLAFSPDGQSIAYGAATDRGPVAVINDIEAATLYDGIVRGGKIVFDGRDSLHLLAVSKGEVFLVTLKISRM